MSALLADPILDNLETEVMDINEIVKSFNDEELKVYNEIKEYISSCIRTDLLARYQLALKINKIYLEQKNSTGLYGKNFLGRLAKAIGLKSANPFREMIKIAQRWPDEEIFVKEVVNQIPNIRWKGLLALTHLDKEEFQSQIEKIKTATLKELQALAKTNQPRPGRTFTRFETIKQLASNVRHNCQQLTKRIRDQWNSFDFENKVNPEDIEQFESLIEIAHNIFELKDALNDFSKRLSDYVDLEND